MVSLLTFPKGGVHPPEAKYLSAGLAIERMAVADELELIRPDLDRWALRSHELAIKATEIYRRDTKYFNTKNKTAGHLFQGPFRAVWVEDNDQLLYLSAYIHKNPVELTGPQGKEHGYQWSSLTDYLNKNRWPTSLLKPEIILEQFNNKQEYQDWIKQSYAKSLQDIGCPVVKI